jgi:hypothetical protein
MSQEDLLLKEQLHRDQEFRVSSREQDFELDKWRTISSDSANNAAMLRIETWGADPGVRLFPANRIDTVKYLVLAKYKSLESAVGVISIYPSEKNAVGVPINALAAFFNRSMFETLFHEPVLIRYFVYGATLDTIKFEGDLLL